MSDLFTQQSTMPELFKTGEDIAEELKAQTVEPNTATDLLLNSDSKPNRFSRQCAENEEPDADLTENLLHDEKSNKNTITGTNTPRSSRASAYYDLLRSQHKNGHYGPTDFFAGPFLICGDGGEDLISLTDSQITKYEKKYHSPLIFMELYPKPITLKCTPELYAKCMGEEHQHDTQENERDER